MNFWVGLLSFKNHHGTFGWDGGGTKCIINHIYISVDHVIPSSIKKIFVVHTFFTVNVLYTSSHTELAMPETQQT
jgi:hypothetical protein